MQVASLCAGLAAIKGEALDASARCQRSRYRRRLIAGAPAIAGALQVSGRPIACLQEGMILPSAPAIACQCETRNLHTQRPLRPPTRDAPAAAAAAAAAGGWFDRHHLPASAQAP